VPRPGLGWRRRQVTGGAPRRSPVHASARSSRRGQGHQGATTRRGGRGADQGGAHRDADLGGDRGDRRPTATQARAPCLATSLVSMHGPLGPRTAGASANAPPCSKARDQRRGVSVPAPVAAATSTPLAAGRQQAHTSLAARHDVTRPRGTTTPSPTPTTAPPSSLSDSDTPSVIGTDPPGCSASGWAVPRAPSQCGRSPSQRQARPRVTYPRDHLDSGEPNP